MKNNTIKIDACKRDYELDEFGNLKIDKGLGTPAFFRLRIPRNQWLYAPNTQYGSDFYLFQKNPTTGTGRAFVNTGDRALQPLIDQGRADNINVELTERSRNGVGLEVDISQVRNDETETIFVPIGRD